VADLLEAITSGGGVSAYDQDEDADAVIIGSATWRNSRRLGPIPARSTAEDTGAATTDASAMPGSAMPGSAPASAVTPDASAMPGFALASATTASAMASQLPARSGAGKTRFRRAFTVVLVVALVATGAVAFAVERGRSGQTAAQRAATAALAVAAANREHAAAWIAAQVSRGVIVACDPLMCTALQQSGFPAADLAPIGPGSTDPLGSGIVVSTAALRSQLGTRLASVYAPVLLASFGTGPSRVQVRVAAVGGAASYLSAEQEDLAARKLAGAQLLRNANIHVSPAARQQLLAGQVDSRLLITLAALAARLRVQVGSFSDAGPGAAPVTPLRRMTIIAASPSYEHRVLAFLAAQRAPLLAVTTVSHAGATTVLQVEFTAPSPPGLLGSGGQS
jgi:hypothetical protein